MSAHSISECLVTLEISTEDLESCYNLEQEFKVIKKAYFKVSSGVLSVYILPAS